MKGEDDMLERDIIQSRGFRNIGKDGAAVGFEIPVRLPYYRGIWLSQLRPGRLVVDGEAIAPADITWILNGKAYPQVDVTSNGDTHWFPLDVAVLSVWKPGGLAQGFHDIEVDFNWSASYMPPSMDTLFGTRLQKRRLVLV
jgi:hypothetical protein